MKKINLKKYSHNSKNNINLITSLIVNREKRKSNKLVDYLLEIEGNENEPYVNMPNSTHFMDHSK